MAKGYISLHRQLQDNWLWQEQREFSKAEAWIDMLMTVNHTEADLVIKMEVFKCGVGESLLSLDSWAKRWGWDKSKVRRFFKLLEAQQMIVTKSERKTTRLSICNYASYQCKRHEDETQMKRKRNADETQTTPNNNDNNKNNENKFSFKNALIDLGIDKQVVIDWLKVRKSKSATNSETAFKSICKNIDSMKEQLTPNQIITECVERSWAGCRKDWFINSGLYKDATPQQKPISERMNHSTYYSNWMIKYGIKDPTAMTREQKQEMFDNYTNNVEI